MYYRCNNGGWNKSHGTIEQTPRIDSFEAAKQEYDGILFVGHTTLDFGRYIEYGQGEVGKEFVDLCGRWRLRLTRINNGFGGTRAFWLCPYCRRRVRYLYFNGNDFVCRECAKLNYKSQQETKDSMRDYRKGMELVERRLAPPCFPIDGFSFVRYLPERPKGMHEATYRRYLSRFFRYQSRYMDRMIADISRICR